MDSGLLHEGDSKIGELFECLLLFEKAFVRTKEYVWRQNEGATYCYGIVYMLMD